MNSAPLTLRKRLGKLGFAVLNNRASSDNAKNNEQPRKIRGCSLFEWCKEY